MTTQRDFERWWDRNKFDDSHKDVAQLAWEAGAERERADAVNAVTVTQSVIVSALELTRETIKNGRGGKPPQKR